MELMHKDMIAVLTSELKKHLLGQSSLLDSIGNFLVKDENGVNKGTFSYVIGGQTVYLNISYVENGTADSIQVLEFSQVDIAYS